MGSGGLGRPEELRAELDGSARTANVDILARLTRELSDTELAAMAEHDESLADAAGRLGEDSFRKRITRLRDKIRADGGTTAAQQVVNDSFVRITHPPPTATLIASLPATTPSGAPPSRRRWPEKPSISRNTPSCVLV